jgi:hypothetical protein
LWHSWTQWYTCSYDGRTDPPNEQTPAFTKTGIKVVLEGLTPSCTSNLGTFGLDPFKVAAGQKTQAEVVDDEKKAKAEADDQAEEAAKAAKAKTKAADMSDAAALAELAVSMATPTSDAKIRGGEQAPLWMSTWTRYYSRRPLNKKQEEGRKQPGGLVKQLWGNI